MSQVFPDCQHICKHLRRMELVRQTVPHRNSRIFCQLLHDVLSVSAVLDTVKHASQHTRGVRNALFFADLRTGWIKVSHMHSEIMCCHLKRTPCAGACLLENQRDIFSDQTIMQNSLLLLALKIRCQINQVENLFRCVIHQF